MQFMKILVLIFGFFFSFFRYLLDGFRCMLYFFLEYFEYQHQWRFFRGLRILMARFCFSWGLLVGLMNGFSCFLAFFFQDVFLEVFDGGFSMFSDGTEWDGLFVCYFVWGSGFGIKFIVDRLTTVGMRCRGLFCGSVLVITSWSPKVVDIKFIL